MPRIIRWFPVTHEINADPEMWELRETHGDRAGFIWLECLSIGDRNDGVVGPASDQTRNQLASKCRTNRVKVESVLDWCRVKGWLVFGEHIQISNYKKYHTLRADKKTLLAPLPSYPSYPSEPNLNKKEEEGIKIKSPRKRGPTKSAYPIDFKICDSIWLQSEQEGWANLEEELQAFKDHHVSKGNTFSDWDSAFRNWLRNSKKWGINGKAGNATSAGGAEPKGWAAIREFRKTHGIDDPER